MPAAILLRDECDGSARRLLARQARDAGQARRLFVLAAIYAGAARADAAQTGGVGGWIVRAFVVRFNAGVRMVAVNRKAPGARSIFENRQRQDACGI